MRFFMFIVLTVCAGKCVGYSCPVVMSPPAVVVRYGDALSANCTSLTNTTEGMGWESSAGGTDLRTNVTSVPLNIKSVEIWDLSPQCYINYLIKLENDVQCSAKLPVTVYKMMDSVSLSKESGRGIMVEGEKYHMQCDIANVAPARNLTVYWHKGNKIVHTETFDDTSPGLVNKSSGYDLIANRDDNGVQLWCEAKLEFSQAELKLPPMHSESRKVTVLYSPTFIKPENETVEVTAQSQLILNCTATGNPKPIYSWQSPQLPQQTNNNQAILAPSFYLLGTYSCTVSNKQGTRTKHFNVIEATRNRTTFTAIVVVFVSLGVLLAAAGFFTVTPAGTFSFNKGSYKPTSSGPV